MTHRFLNPHGLLPRTGVPVRAPGIMGDANHTPEACAERRAFMLATFKPGQIIRRNDGAVLILDTIDPPNSGGGCHGWGRPFDERANTARGAKSTWRTGPLEGCEIVRESDETVEVTR